MATVWLTYAWDDNKTNDVDFVAQELEAAGLTVKLDRWNIQSGQRLWEQIENFIQNPAECDAWLLYATQNSLGSEPCKEEYAYALDRALNKRGGDFPVIAIFPSSVDKALIPAGIRTRLYVSLTDPDWKERIVAAAQKRPISITRPSVQPFAVQVHRDDPTLPNAIPYIIELRPRAGTWAPFFAAIPFAEKDQVRLGLLHGIAGQRPMGSMMTFPGEGPSVDGQWWIKSSSNEATPTQSYFLLCHALPSTIVFGVEGKVQYQITPSQIK